MNIFKIIGLCIWGLTFVASLIGLLESRKLIIGIAVVGFVFFAVGLFITMESDDSLMEALIK